MLFRQLFDPKLAQYAYLIGCQKTGVALIIDPERDIDRYVKIASEEGLRIVAATETGARLAGPVGGAGGTAVAWPRRAAIVPFMRAEIL